MKRIVLHWTAGSNAVSAIDREHYHFIISGNGTVIAGDFKPEDNLSTKTPYAAHTRNCNTGSIGVAVAAMHGARERPFSAGKFPITDEQIKALAGLCADLCGQYGIPVTRKTVLSHAEVQPTLGIAQRGKWDIAWIPGMDKPGNPVLVGDNLREMILREMTAPKAPAHPDPAEKPRGGLAGLIRALLALFGK